MPQDYAEAVKWYRKAADQGYPAAQYNLGVMYDQGQGVPQDYAEAARWYRKAADQGDANAQLGLGVMYAKGQGVPQDYVEAHMWLNLAASRISADRQKIAAGAREAVARRWLANSGRRGTGPPGAVGNLQRAELEACPFPLRPAALYARLPPTLLSTLIRPRSAPRHRQLDPLGPPDP